MRQLATGGRRRSRPHEVTGAGGRRGSPPLALADRAIAAEPCALRFPRSVRAGPPRLCFWAKSKRGCGLQWATTRASIFFIHFGKYMIVSKFIKSDHHSLWYTTSTVDHDGCRSNRRALRWLHAWLH
jgi:hypothetical protein